VPPAKSGAQPGAQAGLSGDPGFLALAFLLVVDASFRHRHAAR
jgi:hypothetical protein